MHSALSDNQESWYAHQERPRRSLGARVVGGDYGLRRRRRGYGHAVSRGSHYVRIGHEYARRRSTDPDRRSGIGPLARPAPVRPALVELSRALAFDKILSGNKDISCMTCHLPGFATGDGRSLSIGQGATGLGTARVHPHGDFIPRNAPPAFNLFANKALFWDGRVEIDGKGALKTPAGNRVTPHMARAFEFGALSALPLFPVLSREEMRAADGNELADIKDKQPQQVWEAL